MATGRKTVVVGQVIDPDAWGNLVWDQSVQTFASSADRATQFPGPKLGAVTFLEDVKRLELWDGTRWSPHYPTRAGERLGTTSAGGDLSVTFDVQFAVACTMVVPADRSTGAGTGAVIWKVISMTATGAVLRAFPGTGTTPIANASLAVGYVAVGI